MKPASKSIANIIVGKKAENNWYRTFSYNMIGI